jgi:hypothetical protein
MMRSIVPHCALLLGMLACTNAGEQNTLPTLTRGSIGVVTYLDRNATHTLDTGDTVYAGIRIALLLPGGTDTLRTATTNDQGIASFDSLPIGTYRIVVDRHALGDSIGVVVGDTGVIQIVALPPSASAAARVVRLGYTEVDLAQARALPVGKRVIVRARVTSPLQAFRDTSAFLNDTSGYIRVLHAVAQTGTAGNVAGDSVLVLATTDSAGGQPVLSGGHFTRIAGGLAPTAQLISVAEAVTANHDSLDAAYVQLSNVTIVDTMAATPDFAITVADSADSTTTIKVVLDQLLNAPHSVFVPGHTATLRGVLIPNGDGTWYLKPRSATDVVLN